MQGIIHSLLSQSANTKHSHSASNNDSASEHLQIQSARDNDNDNDSSSDSSSRASSHHRNHKKYDFMDDSSSASDTEPSNTSNTASKKLKLKLKPSSSRRSSKASSSQRITRSESKRRREQKAHDATNKRISATPSLLSVSHLNYYQHDIPTLQLTSFELTQLAPYLSAFQEQVTLSESSPLHSKSDVMNLRKTITLQNKFLSELYTTCLHQQGVVREMVHVDEQLKHRMRALTAEKQNLESRDAALRTELQSIMTTALAQKDEQIRRGLEETERLRGAFEHGLNENAALFQSKYDAMRLEYVEHFKATAASNEEITRECAQMKSNAEAIRARHSSWTQQLIAMLRVKGDADVIEGRLRELARLVGDLSTVLGVDEMEMKGGDEKNEGNAEIETSLSFVGRLETVLFEVLGADEKYATTIQTLRKAKEKEKAETQDVSVQQTAGGGGNGNGNGAKRGSKRKLCESENMRNICGAQIGGDGEAPARKKQKVGVNVNVNKQVIPATITGAVAVQQSQNKQQQSQQQQPPPPVFTPIAMTNESGMQHAQHAQHANWMSAQCTQPMEAQFSLASLSAYQGQMGQMGQMSAQQYQGQMSHAMQMGVQGVQPMLVSHQPMSAVSAVSNGSMGSMMHIPHLMNAPTLPAHHPPPLPLVTESEDSSKNSNNTHNTSSNVGNVANNQAPPLPPPPPPLPAHGGMAGQMSMLRGRHPQMHSHSQHTDKSGIDLLLQVAMLDDAARKK